MKKKVWIILDAFLENQKKKNAKWRLASSKKKGLEKKKHDKRKNAPHFTSNLSKPKGTGPERTESPARKEGRHKVRCGGEKRGPRLTPTTFGELREDELQRGRVKTAINVSKISMSNEIGKSKLVYLEGKEKKELGERIISYRDNPHPIKGILFRNNW